MPSNPKLYIEGQVRFLTISLQRGLPLFPNHLVKNILLSCPSQAVRLFPITISKLEGTAILDQKICIIQYLANSVI